jgi:putative tricarboxylic transport membrane protein
MRVFDRASSVFWFLFSIAVLIQSLRMGVGTLGNPGMGLMACGASGLMALLSLILLVQSILGKKGAEERVRPFAGIMLGRVIGAVVGIFFYTLFLASLGYLIATFLLMACLLVIVGRLKWWLLITFPGLTSLVSYYVFAKLFQCPLPAGILGF